MTPTDRDKLDQSNRLFIESARLDRAGLTRLADEKFDESQRLRRSMTVNPDLTNIANHDLE